MNQKLVELLNLYCMVGIDEIIQNDILAISEVIKTSSSQETKVSPVIEFAGSNIITENFFNLSQAELISRLAQKQQSRMNGNLAEQPLVSLAAIVSENYRKAGLADSLEELEKLVRDFEGCSLKKMANNTVFSDGNPRSEVVIIGEAPGNQEDLQGIPFCGESGKLLDEMFASIGLSRKKNLYITNTLFWRPPGNRRPTDEELAMCRPFVERHIALIAPKLIVLMGATAAFSVLNMTDPISKIRGKFFDYTNQFLAGGKIKTICLFHPSYLLRQPGKKRLAWQDLLTIDNFLNHCEE